MTDLRMMDNVPSAPVAMGKATSTLPTPSNNRVGRCSSRTALLVFLGAFSHYHYTVFSPAGHHHLTFISSHEPWSFNRDLKQNLPRI